MNWHQTLQLSNANSSSSSSAVCVMASTWCFTVTAARHLAHFCFPHNRMPCPIQYMNSHENFRKSKFNISVSFPVQIIAILQTQLELFTNEIVRFFLGHPVHDFSPRQHSWSKLPLFVRFENVWITASDAPLLPLQMPLCNLCYANSSCMLQITACKLNISFCWVRCVSAAAVCALGAVSRNKNIWRGQKYKCSMRVFDGSQLASNLSADTKSWNIT